MSYKLGPIALRNLTNHTWSAGQPGLTSVIQGQSETGFITGQEMISYNLLGAFFADTATEARIQRKQINDIIANPAIQQIYIIFDQDDEELSGWFAIDSLETTIEAAVFNHYPFTLGVRRIQGNGLLDTQIWKSHRYAHVYTTASNKWVALPYNRGNDFIFNSRVGGDGAFNSIKDNLVVDGERYPTYDTRENPTNANSDYYLARCQIYDTISSSTTSDPNNPDETNWIERFGTYINFEGDLVLRNNLLMYIWDATLGGSKLYVWTGSNWEIACNTFTLVFSDTPTNLTVAHKPTVEYFDWNKIIWYENWTEDENRNVSIRYKMLRGSYTLHISIKSDHGDLQSTSGITKYSGNSHSSYDENLITSNYRVARGTSVLGNPIQYGFFYTDGGAGGGAGGAVTLGYTTAEKVWTRLGLFATSDPIQNSVSVSTIAQQYLANMNFQETIINPLMMI